MEEKKFLEKQFLFRNSAARLSAVPSIEKTRSEFHQAGHKASQGLVHRRTLCVTYT